MLRLRCVQVLVSNMWSVGVLPQWYQTLYILQVDVILCTSSKVNNFMRMVIVAGGILALAYGYFIVVQLRNAFLDQVWPNSWQAHALTLSVGSLILSSLTLLHRVLRLLKLSVQTSR